MVARPQLANFDEVIADDGVSGVSTRLAERPEGRRLYDKPGSSVRRPRRPSIASRMTLRALRPRWRRSSHKSHAQPMLSYPRNLMT
jgi:hypothetical protein